jgi:hypothetical protein
MSKKKMIVVYIVAVLFVAANPALANITIDFEDFPDGPFAAHVKSGVAFTASGGGGQIYRTTAPNGTESIIDFSSPTQKELRADITVGATFVSVDLGDYGDDSDKLFLEIFQASGTSLGYTDLTIASDFTGMETLSLTSVKRIAYAVFGARSPAVGGSSVHADNFEFTPIPAPGAILLGSIGVALVGWLRMQKGL